MNCSHGIPGDCQHCLLKHYATKPDNIGTVGHRKRVDPNAHLGADQERFERGWHPDFDEGVDNC